MGESIQLNYTKQERNEWDFYRHVECEIIREDIPIIESFKLLAEKKPGNYTLRAFFFFFFRKSINCFAVSKLFTAGL